jgi:GAF domain-containing protein
MLKGTDLDDLQSALRHSGLNAALLLLNSRVPHRFTAVYKLDGDVMRNVAIVDKQNEVVPASFAEIPLTHSFCQFVLRDGVFITGDTSQDERLEGHAYKGILNSYVGLPLSKADGDLFGTFCHFDFPAQTVSDEEFDFLTRAVRALPPYVIS